MIKQVDFCRQRQCDCNRTIALRTLSLGHLRRRGNFTVSAQAVDLAGNQHSEAQAAIQVEQSENATN